MPDRVEVCTAINSGVPGMSTSTERQSATTGSALAVSVEVTDDSLTVELEDGRTISAPLPWYPRLLNETPAERRNWRLIGRGVGINWPDLDEDISVEGMLAGRGSGEGSSSLQRWLSSRHNKGAA